MKKVVLSISALKAMNFLFETVIAPKHSIIAVQDAMDGMQVLRNRSTIDVVIVDLDYDTPDNIEFINHIKSSRLYSSCKVIALSSSGKNGIAESDTATIDHLISKPFSPELVLNYVNNMARHNAILTA